MISAYAFLLWRGTCTSTWNCQTWLTSILYGFIQWRKFVWIFSMPIFLLKFNFISILTTTKIEMRYSKKNLYQSFEEPSIWRMPDENIRVFQFRTSEMWNSNLQAHTHMSFIIFIHLICCLLTLNILSSWSPALYWMFSVGMYASMRSIFMAAQCTWFLYVVELEEEAQI